MRASGWMPAHAQQSLLAGLGSRPSLRLCAAGVLAAGAAILVGTLGGGQADPSTPTGAVPRHVVADQQAVATPDLAQRAVRKATRAGAPAPVRRVPSANRIVLAPPSQLAADGIPATALQAYRRAAVREQARDPGCGLSWPLLAAIGRVESDHGRFAGAVLRTDGYSTPRVIGVQLNGDGTALVWDTDHGLLDGDPVYDRAVGPMQFIPSTWARYGETATGSGTGSPFDMFDAAAAAADYLCAAGGTLTSAAGQLAAVFAYNHSVTYVAEVLALEAVYAQRTGLIVPTSPPGPVPTQAHALPPVNPGPPLGLVASAGTRGSPARPAPPVAQASGTLAPGTASTAPSGTPLTSLSGEPSTAPPGAPTSRCPTVPPSASAPASASGTPAGTPTPRPTIATPTPTPTTGTSTGTPTATPEPCGAGAGSPGRSG